MNALKLIGLTFVQIFKEACLLPQAIAKAIKQRQRRTVLHELEVERIDRIRNPEKYRGK